MKPKFSRYQQGIINDLRDGWKIETDGTGADLIRGRERRKIIFHVFQALYRQKLLELCDFYNRGVDYEVYQLIEEEEN